MFHPHSIQNNGPIHQESTSCVYIPNIIPSDQHNNIQYQPVCLEASEHQFIVTLMFSFPHVFNASQGEMSSWGFLKEILFVYDCAVVWLQCPQNEFWLVLSCCYVFANVSVWCRLHATIMWQHVGSAARDLRKWLARMRWHVSCVHDGKEAFISVRELFVFLERTYGCVRQCLITQSQGPGLCHNPGTLTHLWSGGFLNFFPNFI